MPEEPSTASGAFGGSSQNRNTADVSARVGLRLDRTIANQWLGTYDQLIEKVRKLKTEVRRLNSEVNNTGRAINGLGVGGGAPSSASTTTANAIASASAASRASVQPAAAPAAGGGGAGAGGGGTGLSTTMMMSGNPYVMAAGAAVKVVNSITGAVKNQLANLDARIERSYDRSLEADRLAVYYQQSRGISQQQYYDRFRKPLQGYRLGVNGINTMLAMQATTGINAQRMAPGVEAIRAITGYSLGTGDVTNLIQTMASPEVNNRMTMTMGTGLYGLGGAQRDPMAVIQRIVQAAGLTNENVVRGAQQPGSMTRARLTALGVPPEMQDIVIQYAMENIQYQKKNPGAKGMYNPSDRSQLRTMGVDKNFATEREVTDTRREQREESFYNKQKGAFAQNERNIQAMEKLTQKIEELTSALISGRIRTKNNPVFKFFSGMFGRSFSALEALGDPPESGGGAKTTARTGRGSYSTGGLHNTFAQRLQQLMNERPSITIGNGFRTYSQQRTLFTGRYSKTSEDTGVYWNGSYWKKNRSNDPDAAPPGLSMHELGLAADLSLPTKADEEWLQRNASRFGLKTFGDVINEPWHVQPLELPNSRRDYEKAGAPWGRPAGAAQFDESTQFGGSAEGYVPASGRVIISHSQMSIAESMALSREGMMTSLGGGAFGRKVTLRGRRQITGTDDTGRRNTGVVTGVPSASNIPAGFKFRTTPMYGGWGYYVPAKFSPADLDALHRFEQADWTRVVNNADGKLMGGFAMNQYNWNRAGGLQYAKSPNFATPEQQTAVAKVLLDQLHAHDGFESIVKGLISWPGVGKLPSVDLPVNTPSSTTYSSKSGDPMLPSRGSGGTVIVESGGGVTIAPNIYIQSSGNTAADARRAAEEVATIVTRRLKNATLRSM